MLDLLGTIGGNALSLPGILGLALGMTTRNWMLAAIMGGVIGIIETFVFLKFDVSELDPLDQSIAVLVGVCAGMVGCAIRHKGATV